MSQYKLYEVAIIEQPKRGKKDDDEQSTQVPKIVLEPRVIMARGDQDAAVKAALKFKDDLGNADPERIDIIVRPF